jgi:acyl-CoA synthetase (AMP-forming)/AMP-acid ligase II
MVRASARRFGPREAIVHNGRRMSYADLDAALMASARAAIGAGVGPGDRVAIWAPNSAEYIVAVLGVLAAGAWVVPMNTRMKGAEAAYVLEKTAATTLMTVTGFLGLDRRPCSPRYSIRPSGIATT